MKEIKELPKTLCQSCTHCHEIVTDNGELIRWCITSYGETPRRVIQNIAKCNKYEKVGRIGVYEMGKIAWILEVNKKEVGFVPPSRRKTRQEKEDVLDDCIIPDVREDY